jgi:hypothetical protein
LKVLEKQLIKNRNQIITNEFKIIGTLYSEGFLKRILRLIDIYTSVSTTKKISILQPL